MLKKEVDLRYFYLLPIGVILNMFLSWEYFEYYTPDSHNYINIAGSLPVIKNSIFPIFYPLALRLSKFILGNYDLAAKGINLCSVLLLFFFTRCKTNSWKEFWVLFTFAPFQTIFSMALSESLFLVFLLLYFFYNYHFITQNEDRSKSILLVLILFGLFLIKYNAFFYLIANAIFAVWVFRKNKGKSLLQIGIVAIVLVLCFGYLMINYNLTGHFTGVRGLPPNHHYPSYFFHSLKNIPLSLDPFSLSFHRITVSIKLFFGLRYITFLPYFISYVLCLFCFIKLKKIRNKRIDHFFLFLMINSIVFLAMLFLSAAFTIIDVLNSRLLLGFYFLFLSGLIYFLKINDIKIKSCLLLVIGIGCNFLYFLSIITFFDHI